MLVGFQNQGFGVIVVLGTDISTKLYHNQNVFYAKYLSKLQRDD